MRYREKCNRTFQKCAREKCNRTFQKCAIERNVTELSTNALERNVTELSTNALERDLRSFGGTPGKLLSGKTSTAWSSKYLQKSAAVLPGLSIWRFRKGFRGTKSGVELELCTSSAWVGGIDVECVLSSNSA